MWTSGLDVEEDESEVDSSDSELLELDEFLDFLDSLGSGSGDFLRGGVLDVLFWDCLVDFGNPDPEILTVINLFFRLVLQMADFRTHFYIKVRAVYHPSDRTIFYSYNFSLIGPCS